MFIFNLSSTVYASHKAKHERFVVTGTLVSTGLAAVGKAGIIAALCAVGLRLGLDMNSTTQSAIDKFIEDNPDLINQENFGKSENGLIAVSKNAIDKFTTFLKDIFKTHEENPSKLFDSITYNVDNFTLDTVFEFRSDSNYYFSQIKVVNFPEYFFRISFSKVANKWYYSKISSLDGTGSTAPLTGPLFSFSYTPNFGYYNPDNSLLDDLGNIYTGNGDYILNPSWDISSNAGALEGFPALPWEDKIFGSIGNIGVLNPDGTITGNPSIPDVENPDIPDTEVDSSTGILAWLSKFWENLWNFFMELVKALFYPTAAISAWESFRDNFQNKFKFVGQLQDLKFSTNNNERFKVVVPIAGFDTVIKFPDTLEAQVPFLRNLLKYFFFISTLFICVSILRPKFSVNSD